MLAPTKREDGIPPNQIEYKTRRLVNDYLQPPKVTRKYRAGQQRLAEVREDMENAHDGAQRARAAARARGRARSSIAPTWRRTPRSTAPRAAGASITCAPTIRRRTTTNWFCHTLLRKKDGRMTSEKRAVEPYVVPIADEEKDLYDKQRIRASA